MSTKIPLGISSCLLGQQVRYDGGHKKDNYITKTLGEYFDFKPFCPEVGAGLGIPRPTIRLVRMESLSALQALEGDNPDQNHTEALREYSERIMPEMSGLCGYILKKDSPSCGMERVKVYQHGQKKIPPVREGSGIFAQMLQQYYPNLPLEEEGRLHDAVLRENFIERVFVYHRWLQLQQQGITPGQLVNFHSEHKYSIMAHDQDELRQLGRLVAGAGQSDDFQTLCKEYIDRLMTLMAIRVSRGRHANVLTHLLGYVSKALDKQDRAEMVDVIENYQQGYVPLIVPLTLLNHHFRRHPHPYIERQYYLHPHPGELMLRNSL